MKEVAVSIASAFLTESALKKTFDDYGIYNCTTNLFWITYTET